ncbi:hypothetical protein ES702_00564 [subsurface metagenome]
MHEIRFIDLFSGIGGFRRGLEKTNEEIWNRLQNLDTREHSPHPSIGEQGWRIQSKNTPRSFRCVWSCDNNKYANQVYTARFGEENHYPGDIKGVDPRNIPDFDLLCAGFPCQAFSVAGKRKGFKDTRGTLFFEILRVAKAKRPTLLLLENVKGLLNHDGGRTFTIILQSLDELGYWIEWQVLNSKHFGVPQNRERVFIIGHLRGRSTRPVFPITEPNGVPDTEPREREGIASCLDSNYHKGTRRQRTFVVDPFNKAERQDMMAGAVKTNQGSNTSTGTVLAILTDNLGGNIKDRIKDANKAPAWTLGGSTTRVALPRIANTVDQDGYLRRGERDRDEKGKPIITSIANRRIRRLTPIECELLQSFPKNWTKHGITFLTPDTYIRDNADAEKTNTLEILSTMWEAVGTKKGEGRGLRELISLLKKEILQPRVYEGIIQEKMEGQGSSSTGKLQSKTIDYCDGMFDMWRKIKPRYSPQRQKQIEQLFRKLTSSVSRVPHQITSQGRRMESTTTSGKRQNGKICLIHWLSDTQRYKCLGNAVTVNVIRFLGDRIKSSFSKSIRMDEK